MDVILVTGEYVSKKSTFSLCLKPLATRRALYLSTVPSGFSFFFNTHLQPIGLQPGGKSAKCQVLLDSRESISSFMASCHKSASKEVNASWSVNGSSSNV
ncbi:unnamed protein product [Lupinus luteus]|uniref:Uncharacterized protein n=1 Tax=Lupinus luteus TaxID=3873 RepID=A0AAV1W1X6_LUPLU